MNKLNYQGDSKILKNIVNSINELIEGGGGASTLEDLTDVNINNPTNGQVLKYDAANEEWVNGQSGSSYTAGDGIDITSNVISLAYLKVVNGTICVEYDDGE